MNRSSYNEWIKSNDSYPEHNHVFSVRFYSRHPDESKTVLHREFGTFQTQDEAKKFASEYVKTYTNKGFIKRWEIQPICIPVTTEH